MTSSPEDNSWNLSFDDDPDTSAERLSPSSTAMLPGKRICSTTSDEGYKSGSAPSTSTSSAQKADASTPRQHATSKISTSRLHSKPKNSSHQLIGLGQSPSQHVHASSSTSASSSASSQGGKSSTSNSSNLSMKNSKHRTANSMAYTSSPSTTKWQGGSMNLHSSPTKQTRIISPHTSPLMSSFSRAREQRETITAGTLSGLLSRFFKKNSRHSSNLRFRFAFVMFFFILTSLVLTRRNQQQQQQRRNLHQLNSHSQFSDAPSVKAYASLNSFDDDIVLLAARALAEGELAEQEETIAADSQHTDEEDINLEEVAVAGTPPPHWRQEERKMAHARIAQALHDVNDEILAERAARIYTPEEIAESLQDDQSDGSAGENEDAQSVAAHEIVLQPPAGKVAHEEEGLLSIIDELPRRQPVVADLNHPELFKEEDEFVEMEIADAEDADDEALFELGEYVNDDKALLQDESATTAPQEVDDTNAARQARFLKPGSDNLAADLDLDLDAELEPIIQATEEFSAIRTPPLSSDNEDTLDFEKPVNRDAFLAHVEDTRDVDRVEEIRDAALEAYEQLQLERSQQKLFIAQAALAELGEELENEKEDTESHESGEEVVDGDLETRVFAAELTPPSEEETALEFEQVEVVEKEATAPLELGRLDEGIESIPSKEDALTPAEDASSPPIQARQAHLRAQFKAEEAHLEDGEQPDIDEVTPKRRAPKANKALRKFAQNGKSKIRKNSAAAGRGGSQPVTERGQGKAKGNGAAVHPASEANAFEENLFAQNVRKGKKMRVGGLTPGKRRTES